MANYSVVSLFAGCGGMDLGFVGGFNFLKKNYAKNNFSIIWANELSPAACTTYRANFDHDIINDDIWNAIGSLPKSADVVIGGFPCQDISINGKRAGVAGARSGLYKAMVETVDRVKPKLFVAENVKGLLMAYNQDSLQQVIKDFLEIGYSISYKLYNSADVGVPQRRERVFLIGTPVNAPTFEFDQIESASWITAEEAIADLEFMDRDPKINHIWSEAKKSPDQGSRRLKSNMPATTIRAECHGNIQFHYKLDRRISMREAARFQSFPDNFTFACNLRETERQVGNAVPPILGWHIAQQVSRYLNSLPKELKKPAKLYPKVESYNLELTL